MDREIMEEEKVFDVEIRQEFPITNENPEEHQIASIRQRIEADYGGRTNLAFYRSCAVKNSTESEFWEFMYLCWIYKLDPIRKEIFFIKYGGKPTIVVARDGLLKIANQNPMFNGMSGGCIYEGDEICMQENGAISIKYGPDHTKFDQSKLTGAFCNVYRKDRDITTSAIATLKDYDKKNGNWATYKNAMILKCAESIALKKSFNLSGIVSREEMDSDGE